MAFDDDKIRIEVEGAQAAAQLEALAEDVRLLEEHLASLSKAAITSGTEFDNVTEKLAKAKAEFAEAGKQVEQFNQKQDEGGEKTKSLADKYVTLGLKVFGARQVLMAAGEAMRSVAQATGDYSGATKDAIDQTDNLLQSIASLDLIGASKALGQLAGQTAAWWQELNETNIQLGNLADKDAAKLFGDILAAQRALVEGHKEEIAQLGLKAQALSREIDLQQQNGSVSEFLKEKLQEYLDAYAKAHEAIPRYLQEQAFELNVVSSETERLGNKAVEAHTKAASAAKTHSDSLEKIAADQEKVIANAEKMIADIDAAAIKANQAQAASGNAGVAENAANAAKLKEQIKAIEDSPIITAEQQSNLDSLKNQLLDNTKAASDLNSVFTVTADDYLTAEESLAKYNAELAIAGQEQAKLTQWSNQAQATEKELADARWDNLEALNQMEDAAGDLGGSYDALRMSTEDVADAAGSIGDEAKKGTDKAKEGLAGMNEGLDEALPKAKELRDVLQEIVALGAQADI